MDASESPQRNELAERDESPAASRTRSLVTVAVLAAAALAVEWILRPVLGELAVAPVFFAVALAAWLAGAWPGVLLSIAAAAVAMIGFARPASTLLAEFTTTDSILVVACGIGISLVVAAGQRQSHRLRQERLDSNSFAAKLHLQLMLAEAEIERLRQAALPAPPPRMIDLGAPNNGASPPLPGEPSGSIREEWRHDPA